MKPDSGFEMEEEPYDPRELFADVALLITEARTPDLSKKGRVEGPHCPPILGSKEHDCDRHKEQCRKASDILTQHKILLRNNIPMRIDVLLFPPCDHGLREETVVVGAMFSTVDAFVLLERWDIQLINKRSSERHEGFVGGRALLQAIRSYLHFSQLSSWLISTGGALSLRVVYRVYAPGETVGYTFERLPEVHNFPPADLGDAMMRASVANLPRQSTITSLFCRSPSPGMEQCSKLRKSDPYDKVDPKNSDLKRRRSPDFKGTYEPMPSTSKCDEDYFNNSPPGASSKRHSKDHMEYGKQDRSRLGKSVQMTERPPSGKKICDAKHNVRKEDIKAVCDVEIDTVSHMQKDKMNKFPLLLQKTDALKGEGNEKDTSYYGHLATRLPSNQESKMTVMPPSSLSIDKSVSSDFKTPRFPGQLSPQKSHPYKRQTALFALSNPSTSFHITKRLPSPKVLMTASKKPEPSGYSKRCLDYNDGKKLLEVDNDFSTFKQFEELSATEMEDLVRPLSPSQLDAYLSSLSNKAPKKTSQLDEIPMTKCRFFIGESEKLDDVFESPVATEGEDLKRKATVVTDNREQDLKFKRTAQSLSQQSSAKEDNSDNISSLSLKNTQEDNSHVTCLSQKSFIGKDSSKNLDVQEFEHCLSEKTVLAGESSLYSNFGKDVLPMQAEPNNKYEHSLSTPEPIKSANFPSRILFHKSLSTSEVEEDLASGRKNLKKVLNKLKTELKEPNNVDNYAQVADVFQPAKKEELLKERVDNSVSVKYVSDTNPPELESDGVKVRDSKWEDNQNYNNASKSRKIPVRDKLDDITIPCTVGSEKVDMTDLISDLESMEVHTDLDNSLSHSGLPKSSSFNGSLDSDPGKSSLINSSPDSSSMKGSRSPSNESQSPCNGSPTPVSGSPNVDDEIKHHLKQSSQRQFSLNRGNKSDVSDIALSLCKQLLRKEFQQNVEKEVRSPGKRDYKNLPSPDDIQRFQFHTARSASALFNSSTGLPTRSSPAPMKRKSSGSFDYDCSLTNVRAIKNAVSCSRLTLQYENKEETIEDPRIISTSAPASTNCLLGNFEESMLNGRIEPVGVVDGFTVEIGAGGTFCPKHVTLPVAAYFFQLSDDNAPSPYLGHVNLDALGKRGYHIPRTGTVQVTLFNPNKTVVKMFVVMYDLSDMPASCQTFLRQRTMYMPVDKNSSEPSFLRYLIHLRFASTKSGKIYLHTDIRLIFARDKFEFDPKVANYELRSFTEGPENPKFSPKR